MRSHASLKGKEKKKKKTIQAVLVDGHPNCLIDCFATDFFCFEIFLTRDLQPDGASAGSIAITAIGILAAEFVIRMSMLMMLVLKLRH